MIIHCTGGSTTKSCTFPIVVKNYNYPNNTIVMNPGTPSTCQQDCCKNANCTGVVYDGRNFNCYLKYDFPFVANVNTTSYIASIGNYVFVVLSISLY